MACLNAIRSLIATNFSDSDPSSACFVLPKIYFHCREEGKRTTGNARDFVRPTSESREK